MERLMKSGSTDRTHSLSFVASFFLLIVIVAYGLSFRLKNAPLYAHPDMGYFREFAYSMNRDGLFSVYRDSWQDNHPPIGIASIAVATQIFRSGGGDLTVDSFETRAAVKAAPIVFDIATVLASYWLMLRYAGPFWALLPAAAIGLNPAIIMDSSVWGQTDGIFSFFLVLSVAALYLRRNRASWAAWGLSMLSKLQAIPLLPLLVAATLVPRTTATDEQISWLGNRRTWRGLRVGLVTAIVVIVAVMLPFFLGSGESAWQPIKQGPDYLPFLTIDAYNFWWWQSNGTGNMGADINGSARDSQILPGTPITYKLAGFILFGTFVLLLMLKAVTDPQERNEYLLAGMLYAGFFMLLTQMHERYLYPAIPLFALAMVGKDRSDRPRVDWRGVILFAGFTLTFSYNLYLAFIVDAPIYPLLAFIFPGTRDDVARINILLMIIAVAMLLWPRRFKMPSSEQVSHLYMATRSHG